jgi:hypothetical protein
LEVVLGVLSGYILLSVDKGDQRLVFFPLLHTRDQLILALFADFSLEAVFMCRKTAPRHKGKVPRRW